MGHYPLRARSPRIQGCANQMLEDWPEKLLLPVPKEEGLTGRGYGVVVAAVSRSRVAQG